MARQKRSVGELISSLVFFFAGLWLMNEGKNFYLLDEVFKSIVVFVGGVLSFVAAFRFQIQKLFDGRRW
ncbi:MAG: hypothetical protein CBC71_08310 [Rhodobacteraceae bacterium TMED111]|nr:hypothetical protein [Marinovum sp.]OUV40073.1 MAG: hypothetical protein CBC71_08310 [Rhodobacteraceae bacterium TMED111]|tara:strand:+ start:12224 stop:12430 length:207 start_codon:yes stop_codon:yes gene_type:complete